MNLLPCSIALLLAGLVGLVHSEALSQFIRHYEPVHYNQDELMYHHHRLRRSMIGPDHVSLQFSAFGRFFDISLKPEKKIFHKNFTLFIDNRVARSHPIKSLIYTGKDKDDPSVVAYGNLVHGVFEGAILTPTEDYHIEPADRYLSNCSFHSVIYRGSDLDLSTVKGAVCGAAHEDVQQEMLKTQMLLGAEHKQRLRKRQTTNTNRDAAKVRCWLNVIGDYKYVTSVGGASTAMGLLINIIQQASHIYEETDFDGVGEVDNIQFGILNITIETSAPASGTPFASNFIGVQSFLDLHSTADYKDFCLSYRFTSRDFEDGVVGLAYVGSQNGAGGICDQPRTQNGETRTLNTGIVTNLNYGRIIAPRISALTFAHEAGHNFGSDHDTAEPDPVRGAYIMYAFATDGSQENNNRFSPRSITNRMFPVISFRGQDADTGCFVEAGNLCGNFLLDDGEMCDCGGQSRRFDNGTCKDDLCCDGSTCQLVAGVQCSFDQGPCCNRNTCMYLGTNAMCSNQTECAMEQFCNGTSPVCPTPEPREVPTNQTFLPCNNGENVCSNGTCTGSICLALGLSACECQTSSEACHVCCRYDNGTCVSTFSIASTSMGSMLPNSQGQYLAVGFPCRNFSGYCDFFNQCMIVDNDGALNRLANFFFNSAGIQQAIDWIISMWWVVLIVVVGILVIMFVIVVIFHVILPRPKYRRKGNRQKKRQQRTVPLQDYHGHHRGGYREYK